MDNLSIDSLARRLEQLERSNRRWKCTAGVTVLGMALSLALGGLLGSRAVVAQQPEKSGGAPAARSLEYKVTEAIFLNQLERPMRELAAEGWEIMQVVPYDWTTVGQGNAGYYTKGLVVARRPTAPGR